jgi:hypothetical protein
VVNKQLVMRPQGLNSHRGTPPNPFLEYTS